MENTQEIKAFEVGKIYEMERPSDSMIAVKFAVVKRSAKFVTVKRLGTRKADENRFMVRVYNGRENFNPYGYALVFA